MTKSLQLFNSDLITCLMNCIQACTYIHQQSLRLAYIVAYRVYRTLYIIYLHVCTGFAEHQSDHDLESLLLEGLPYMIGK